MILVIRFIGTLNAAVWLGAAVFFTFAAGPAFFSEQVRQTPLGAFWPGVMAQFVIERYFCVQYICAVIAIVHQAAEWAYLGRPLQKMTIGLLAGLLCVAFVGGLWLTPKLKKLHLIKYGMTESYTAARLPQEERIQAARSFSRWHGLSRTVDLVALGGLLVYFWRVTHPSDNLRFLNASAAKFRS